MTWPTTNVPTTNLDAGADNPSEARADLKDLADKFNQVRAHAGAKGAAVLGAADDDGLRTAGVPPIGDVPRTIIPTGTNTYAKTGYPNYAAYAEGNVFYMKVPNTNSGSCSLNINGLGAIPLKQWNGATWNNIIATYAQAGTWLTLLYHASGHFAVLAGLMPPPPAPTPAPPPPPPEGGGG